MDTTQRMICPVCTMYDLVGAGASIGGRVMIYKKRCPECGFTALIVPMKPEYEYTVIATTELERKEKSELQQRIRELDNELELLRRKAR